jgi:hypothetical protein
MVLFQQFGMGIMYIFLKYDKWIPEPFIKYRIFYQRRNTSTGYFQKFETTVYLGVEKNEKDLTLIN